MRSAPDGAELLRVARETLLNELLPQLPKELHYPALMTANAMAIAAREAQADDGQVRAEMNMLWELYGSQASSEHIAADDDRNHAMTQFWEMYEAEAEASNGKPATPRLDALARRLASDLRAGRFDDRSRQVGELLLAVVKERLRISNPKYLTLAGLA